MNDLRSDRKLVPVPDQNRPTITRTPPRSRPSAGESDEDTKELKRNGKGSKKSKVSAQEVTKPIVEVVKEENGDTGKTVEIKIDLGAAANVAEQDTTVQVEAGPESRPARRRDAESDEENGDKFPWHHQFKDDEPEELQATSPLLSRAFRATTG